MFSGGVAPVVLDATKQQNKCVLLLKQNHKTCYTHQLNIAHYPLDFRVYIEIPRNHKISCVKLYNFVLGYVNLLKFNLLKKIFYS